MDEYILIRTELVDTFVDQFIQRDAHRIYKPPVQVEHHGDSGRAQGPLPVHGQAGRVWEAHAVEADAIKGERLFGQLLRQEITMRQFMDEYIPIRTELVDQFEQRDAHRI